MNLANKLTVFRIILVIVLMMVPFFNIQGEVLGISISLIVMDIIFIIASITDKLDGYIARSRNQITTFGKFLDPIADKILVIVAMVILVDIGKIPFWIPAIAIIREFVVSGYRLVAVQKSGEVIAASIWGKIKTATQMVGLAAVFIDRHQFGAFLSGSLSGLELVFNVIVTALLSISVIATVFSGWDYLKGSAKLFKGDM